MSAMMMRAITPAGLEESGRQVAIPSSVDNLIVELEHYRRQSEWLTRVNELHGRLAGAVDLASMIEAFSIWLMPLVEHELIAYNNPERSRAYLYCSCHGPERMRVMTAAKRIFTGLDEQQSVASWQADGFYIHNWQLEAKAGCGFMLLLREEMAIQPQEAELIFQALKILHEPLQRALDYEDLYEQASRDTLTGLANRRVFEERINPLLDSARRHGHPLTLATMDLDRFKQINDTYGHAVGDLTLQKVAECMAKEIRSCDLLVRMGGDEFLLVLNDTDLAAAQILGERLVRGIGRLDLPGVGAGILGVSIGLVQWHKGLSKEEWLQRGDEALYQAKAEGRSRVCLAAN